MLGRVKLGSRCFLLKQERKVVSVIGVHQEVSKQTHAVNKSEVYSHYLGLLFRRILAPDGSVGVVVEGRRYKDPTETSKVKMP